MLRLYAVPYWISFPSSEYGGLVIIAAKDKEHLPEIMRQATNSLDKEDITENQLLSAKNNAEDIGIAHTKVPGIVSMFIT